MPDMKNVRELIRHLVLSPQRDYMENGPDGTSGWI